MSRLEMFVIWCVVILAVLMLLYLLLVMPRIFARPAKVFAQKYYAHRGLHDMTKNVPENSIAAFRRALNAGYGIELDVQLSKDRIPVVFHDFTLNRICGVDGRVADYTYEELEQFSLSGTSEKIPRFADVLAMVNGKVPLIVELKIESLDISVCPAADELLKNYKGPYCIESFNPIGLCWYRCNRGRVPRGQLADCFLKEEEYRESRGLCRVLYLVLQNLLTNFLGRPDFIAYNHKYAQKISRKLCRKLFKTPAAAWTVRSREELKAAEEEFDVFIFEGFIPEK